MAADRAAVAALLPSLSPNLGLHAPFASFGGTEAYPTLVEQAAVLLERLANNHPLPRPRGCGVYAEDPETPAANDAR